MIRRCLAVVALVLLSLTPAGAAMDPALQQALKEIEAAAGSVQTLASDFVQEKHLEMFDEVLSSKGRFYFGQPDRLRWELLEPVATGFVLSGDQGRRWHERTGQNEPFSIDSDPAMKLIATQLLAWTRVDLPWLEQNFTMTLASAEPVALRLMPTANGADRFLDHLLIRFAADRRHVTAVEVHEKDGDFTLIRFVHTQVNPPLAPGLFR